VVTLALSGDTSRRPQAELRQRGQKHAFWYWVFTHLIPSAFNTDFPLSVLSQFRFFLHKPLY
jgi:hypothetical protein